MTSTAPGLQVLRIGSGDSVQTDPVIVVGLTGRLRNGNGGGPFPKQSGDFSEE